MQIHTEIAINTGGSVHHSGRQQPGIDHLKQVLVAKILGNGAKHYAIKWKLCKKHMMSGCAYRELASLRSSLGANQRCQTLGVFICAGSLGD
jgi:hypothetical protein